MKSTEFVSSLERPRLANGRIGGVGGMRRGCSERGGTLRIWGALLTPVMRMERLLFCVETPAASTTVRMTTVVAEASGGTAPRTGVNVTARRAATRSSDDCSGNVVWDSTPSPGSESASVARSCCRPPMSGSETKTVGRRMKAASASFLSSVTTGIPKMVGGVWAWTIASQFVTTSTPPCRSASSKRKATCSVAVVMTFGLDANSRPAISGRRLMKVPLSRLVLLSAPR